MRTEIAFCDRCGSRLRQSSAVINASGTGFSLTLSGVPIFACDECMTSLGFHRAGASIEEIVTAVMDALDKLLPDSIGSPLYFAGQCRYCKGELPGKIDKNRAYFSANAPIKPGGAVIGIQYYGDSLTCPLCMRKHPLMTPVTYHEMSRSIHEAASIYLNR